MSSTADIGPGRVILVANLVAKENEGDRVQSLLADVHGHSNSPNEPGCFTYRTARFGNKFVVFEEYENKEAVDAHMLSEPFKALVASGALEGLPALGFYKEFTSAK